MTCSNIPSNNKLSDCVDFQPILLYTTLKKQELPANLFKITDSNKAEIKNFKCFSFPNGLIIEIPKRELFPPYVVELIKPNE